MSTGEKVPSSIRQVSPSESMIYRPRRFQVNMPQPDKRDFLKMADQSGATMVPLVKTVAADLLTPVSAFLKLAEKEPESFLLESVEGGEHVGRYTYLGTSPYMVVTPAPDGIEITRG